MGFFLFLFIVGCVWGIIKIIPYIINDFNVYEYFEKILYEEEMEQ
jgi:hypothetical protein